MTIVGLINDELKKGVSNKKFIMDLWMENRLLVS